VPRVMLVSESVRGLQPAGMSIVKPQSIKILCSTASPSAAVSSEFLKKSLRTLKNIKTIEIKRMNKNRIVFINLKKQQDITEVITAA
jgi:hypothetical protein